MIIDKKAHNRAQYLKFKKRKQAKIRRKELQRQWTKSPEGKKSRATSHAKRKGFKFILLNEFFLYSEGHHVDRNQVIYIPIKLHRSVYHSITKNINMEKINALAYAFLTGVDNNALV